MGNGGQGEGGDYLAWTTEYSCTDNKDTYAYIELIGFWVEKDTKEL